MHSEGGDLMFQLAETPMKVSEQAFFLYLYTDKLRGCVNSTSPLIECALGL